MRFKKLRLALASVIALFCLPVGISMATSPIGLGGSIFPLTLITQPPTNLTDMFNQLEILMNSQLVGLSPTYSNAMTVPSGGTDTSGVTFSTGIQANPLVKMNYSDSFVSTIGLYSTGYTTIIASASGRTIYPAGSMNIMVSGTAASATALALECSDGTLIASWPIADLVDQIPIGLAPYVSTKAQVTLGAGLTKGCGSGKAVYLSNVGTQITTTTHVYVNLPYTEQ